MGWHDVTVHALCVQPAVSDDWPLPRLLLDLDYIVRWVHPVAPETHFSFWIAPSTLVFEDVWDVEGDLDFKGTALHLTIDNIRRSAAEGSRGGPRWHLEGHSFEMAFRATGFRQYMRQPPQHSPHLALTYADRGGISFTETGFA
jgi:hypothetical protein